MSGFETAPSEGPFNARVVAAILLVGIFSFGAWIALIAWSPELAKRDNAGAHPYAKSVAGYAGLVAILKEQDIAVSVSRTSRSIESSDRGLMIMTLEPYGMGAELEDIFIAGPALIVLPKWRAPADRRKPEWSEEMILRGGSSAENVLAHFDTNAEIIHKTSPPSMATPYGSFEPVFLEKIQLMTSKVLEPIIVTQDGFLLARLPGRGVYILSDPDLLNTLGLAEFENARLAMTVINQLRGSAETPVVLDATLHGFARSESLLKLALDIPYIGATLVILAALALLGWGAVIRFGSPEREGRAIALGKEALADSTAGLVTMARRETRMAPGYLALTRRAAAKQVGAPASLTTTELAALFDRMSETGELPETWSKLAGELKNKTTNRDQLIEHARALHLWRQEMTHGIK